MAGSSSYPTTVDNKTALQDGVDYMEADNVNNAYVPITATQTFIGANGKGASWSGDLLDSFNNAAPPTLTKSSSTQITVSAGGVWIKSSGDTNRLWRRNTSTTSVTISNLDSGSTVSANTYYYVFAVADTAATTFTVKFSTSKTAPTGLTNFELIGWFFNEASGSVIDIPTGYLGNVKANGRRPANWLQKSAATDISVTNGSYADMDSMTARFYSNGGPVEIEFAAPFDVTGGFSGDMYTYVQITVDGVSKAIGYLRITTTSYFGWTIPVKWIGDLSTGGHTIAVQWYTDGGTNDLGTAWQYGTKGNRVLTIKEL